LEQTTADGPIKVWVLFHPNDKHVPEADDGVAAIDALATTYNHRAVHRRQLRRTRPGLFDMQDFPVRPDHVQAVRATGADVHVVSRWINGVSVRATRNQIESIARLPFVEVVQPVLLAKKIAPISIARPSPTGSSTASGTFYGESEAQLTEINLINVHNQGYTGQGVVVGILDTGFQRSHAAFNEPGHAVNVLAEFDFIDNDSNTAIQMGDPPNQHRHGTLILGVLGAYKPNAMVGAAYDASFILCKTEDTTDEYEAEEDNYVAGLEFIEANGGDMATASLGYIDWYTQADLNGIRAVTTIAVNTATENGLYCCNAAGNQGHDANPATSTLIAPADALDVLTIGAVDEFGNIAGFSSSGPTADGRVKPELLARGINTRTVWPDNDVDFTGANGTSLSTPLAAGVVACLIEAHPEWSVQRMRHYLMRTASDFIENETFDPLFIRGYGIIDAAAALVGDCNGNMVDDATDIMNGASTDCNFNTVPDECDISLGTSEDREPNGVPDECEHGIPAVSQWGLAITLLFMLVVGTVMYGNRMRHSSRSSSP